HGVGGSLAIWKAQLDFFVHLGYEVVAPDLAGHGASSAPQVAAAYTFYALAEDMRAIFKRYAKKRNVLIGHSYGVSFCTFLAHEYPDLVHKVIMINGGGPTALEPSICSIFNMPACVLHCLSPCLAWSFLKAGFARQGAKEKQLLKEGNAFNVSSFVLRAMMSGQYWPEGDEVYHAELTVPVLLVHGMHDKFVPVEEDQRMAEILLLAFLKLIDEGSHMVMLECPETVNTLLHEFLLWEPEPLPVGSGMRRRSLVCFRPASSASCGPVAGPTEKDRVQKPRRSVFRVTCACPGALLGGPAPLPETRTPALLLDARSYCCPRVEGLMPPNLHIPTLLGCLNFTLGPVPFEISLSPLA
ncbi:protein ABHD8, partial [Fukomys damarensis]|uniref:protein ABHD8 n=1 Tax=Fukomys damarensis TaxID=885580 RepID=UPI0005402B63